MAATHGSLLSRSKGCHTWGHTHDEALANLREAIDLYVQDLIEAGEEIPVNQGTMNCRNQPLLSMYDAHTARDFSSTTRSRIGSRWFVLQRIRGSHRIYRRTDGHRVV